MVLSLSSRLQTMGPVGREFSSFWVGAEQKEELEKVFRKTMTLE